MPANSILEEASTLAQKDFRSLKKVSTISLGTEKEFVLKFPDCQNQNNLQPFAPSHDAPAEALAERKPENR